ncbi:MAG: hypothetical protein ACYDFU_01800, partial [Nitrospirota bacterium]
MTYDKVKGGFLGFARNDKKSRRADTWVGPYNTVNKLIKRIKIILEMIKFPHTIFALPFAFTGAVLAA